MRIAHISDIHVFDGASLSLRSLCNKRMVGAFNWWTTRKKRHGGSLWASLCADLATQQPDHIVITGDLSNLSLPSEFERVRRELDALPFGPARITVIPGNHDAYIPEVQRSQLFENFFYPYMSLGATKGADIVFPWARPLEDEVVVIGVNTAIPTSPFSAEGLIGPQQLPALRNLLQQWQGWHRVVLMHHPPVAYKHDGFRGLRDKKLFQELVAEVGCELILHGHEHRDLLHHLTSPMGLVPVIGVGSGTYTDERVDRCGRYNIYTVQQGSLVQQETRVYSATQGFVTHTTKTSWEKT